MWFRLKKNYITREGEIHFDSWDTVMIKKRAPILVRLEISGVDFTRSWVPGYSFIFSSGGLDHLTLDDLELVEQCGIGDTGDYIFCATNREFVYTPWDHRYLTKQFKFCPRCGKKLTDFPPYPFEEVESYKINQNDFLISQELKLIAGLR